MPAECYTDDDVTETKFIPTRVSNERRKTGKASSVWHGRWYPVNPVYGPGYNQDQNGGSFWNMWSTPTGIEPMERWMDGHVNNNFL